MTAPGSKDDREIKLVDVYNELPAHRHVQALSVMAAILLQRAAYQ